MKHKLEFPALSPVNMVNFFIDALILYDELYIHGWSLMQEHRRSCRLEDISLRTWDPRDTKIKGKNISVFFYEWQKTDCYAEVQGRGKRNFQVFKSLEHLYKGAKKQPQLFYIGSDQIILVLTMAIPWLPDLVFEPLIIRNWEKKHICIYIYKNIVVSHNHAFICTILLVQKEGDT